MGGGPDWDSMCAPGLSFLLLSVMALVRTGKTVSFWSSAIGRAMDPLSLFKVEIAYCTDSKSSICHFNDSED